MHASPSARPLDERQALLLFGKQLDCMREVRLLKGSTLKGCGNSAAADRAAAAQETLQCLNLLVERHLPGVELREHGAHLKGTAMAHSDIDLVLVTTSGAEPSS